MRMPVLGHWLCSAAFKLESGRRVYLRPPRLGRIGGAWAASARGASRDVPDPLGADLAPGCADQRQRLSAAGCAPITARNGATASATPFLIFLRTDDNSWLGGITLSNVRRGVCQSPPAWAIGPVSAPRPPGAICTEALSLAGLNFCLRRPRPPPAWRPPACPTTRPAAACSPRWAFARKATPSAICASMANGATTCSIAMLSDEWRDAQTRETLALNPGP